MGWINRINGIKCIVGSIDEMYNIKSPPEFHEPVTQSHY